MDINSTNYEQWAIDYTESRLSTVEMEKMNTFFENNPELLKEVIDITNFKLEAEEVKHPNPSSLVKRPFLVAKVLPALATAAMLSAVAFGVYFLSSDQDAAPNMVAEVSTPSMNLTYPGGMAGSKLKVEYYSKESREDNLEGLKTNEVIEQPPVLDNYTIPASPVIEVIQQETPIVEPIIEQEIEATMVAVEEAAPVRDVEKQILDDGFAIDSEQSDVIILTENEDQPLIGIDIISTLDNDGDEEPTILDIFQSDDEIEDDEPIISMPKLKKKKKKD